MEKWKERARNIVRPVDLLTEQVSDIEKLLDESNIPKLWNEFLHQTNYSIESDKFTVDVIFNFVKWIKHLKIIGDKK